MIEPTPKTIQTNFYEEGQNPSNTVYADDSGKVAGAQVLQSAPMADSSPENVPVTMGGVVVKNALQSSNFLTGTAGWKLDANGNLEANSGNFRGDITGASGTFSGTLTGGSLNIPDTTTANSMHVDSSGNTWWGANVATGYTGALAYVLATGAAKFQSVQMGGTTRQYSIGDYGIFTFGDGSDGAHTTAGDETLPSDKYYTNLTVATGHTLNPGGYRIFCTGTLTLAGTGKIARNGNAGSAGSAAIGGAGGAALADGYLKGAVAGQTGPDSVNGTGNGPNGVAGTNTSNSLGSNGSAGGNGGDDGGGRTGGTGGTGGTATASNVKLIANWHLATLLDIGSTGATLKFDNSAGAASGAAGASWNASERGGGGGGGGSGGGIIAIYAKDIVIGASASITANGGNGGRGGDGNGNGGGGGGGAGGNGGQILLVYNTLTNNGSITATAGSAGAKGNAGGAGGSQDGTAGTAGTAGNLREFEVSL